MPFEIRTPWPSEGPLLRRLLPRPAERPLESLFLIAFTPAGRLAGASAWTPHLGAVSSLRVHVLPGFRRQGLGRLLAAPALAAARSRAEASFAALSEPDAAPFLASLGFRFAASLTYGRLETDAAFQARILRLAALPLRPGFRVAPCTPDDLPDVTRLYTRYIATGLAIPDGVIPPWISSGRSVIDILWHHHRAVGFIASSAVGDTACIEACVMEPEYRETRENAAFSTGHVARFQPAGLFTILASWSDEAEATARISRRHGALILERDERWVRESPAA